MLRHTPNAITLTRALLAAPIAYAIFHGMHTQALALVVVAASSDALDGFLAKRFQWQSALGAWLDPAADKLLLITCFAMLAYVGAMPVWLLGLVIVRDLVLVGGSVAYHNLIGALTPRPSVLGRLTTLLQVLSVLLVLIARTSVAVPMAVLDTLFLLTAAATCASGIDYVLVWAAHARTQRRPVP